MNDHSITEKQYNAMMHELRKLSRIEGLRVPSTFVKDRTVGMHLLDVVCWLKSIESSLPFKDH